jgi:hypothetical protein
LITYIANLSAKWYQSFFEIQEHCGRRHFIVEMHLLNQSQSQSHIATDGQSISQSVSLGIEPYLVLMTRYSFYCLRVTVLFSWGALSDEKMGLSFVHATGSCQRSPSWVRVPWKSRPYFTVSDWRLPFSSPPTTRRVTVEVFDPASTRVDIFFLLLK